MVEPVEPVEAADVAADVAADAQAVAASADAPQPLAAGAGAGKPAEAASAVAGGGANMHHVRQRNAIDCGLAVIAMLSGRPYEEARKADPFPNKTIGLSLSDFVITLERCSRQRWRVIKPREYISLSKSAIPYACAVIIRQDGRKYGHWISVAEGMVYDPGLPGPVQMSVYDRAGWSVIRVVCRCA